MNVLTLENEKIFVIILGVILVLLLLWALFWDSIRSFSKEWQHIDNELKRADESHQHYWLRRRRRLLLSLIPFVKYRR